jgi:amino acid adenylation domain-containing protein
MHDISKRIAALSPEQRTLLELRLKQKTPTPRQEFVIPKRTQAQSTVQTEADYLPASFTQQRTWFQDQLGHKSAISHNMPISLRIKGSLQVTILEQSIREIIQRHEVLRTTLQTLNKLLVQVVTSGHMFELPVVDLRSLPPNERDYKAEQMAIADASQPFDLTGHLFLRATLFQLDDDLYILLLTMHHIVSDAWSVGVFLRELNILYDAFLKGERSPLPPLPIQYADFAAWQRQYVEGAQAAKEIDYWKQQLKDATTLLRLPSDRPRPSAPSFTGRMRYFVLSQSLTDSLRDLSHQTGVTLFTTLLAAFKTLLYRYTQQEDILVGSPVANRHQTETEELIGCFINTLVFRTNLSGHPTFRELLHREREVVLGAFAHQNIPFETLLDELQLTRNLSHLPLFQVLFVLQNAISSRNVQLHGLKVEYSLVDTGTAQFDLCLHMVDEESGLVGRLEYDTDLFDDATITRIIGHFQTLLAGIIANPDCRLSQLPLLSPDEYRQQQEWNQTEVAYPLNVCIHQLFEAQVEKTPDAIALIFEQQQLTYQDLNHQANQLAHYLQTLEVKPDTLVGVCMERSPLLVVALLGILKAGGAYVPLDPDYPQDRIDYVLQDSQVSILVTQSKFEKLFASYQGHLISIDTSWEAIAQEDATNLVSTVTPEHLAYVIYTSGSTGQPKGVMNAHCGVCNRLLWMQDTYLLTPGDRVLQKTPFSFDVSVWEFFWTLLAGACLVVAKPGGHQDSHYLVDLIISQQITTLHFVPPMLHVFLNEPGVKQCKSLKRVICSGEALSPELQASFFERMECELHNLYGPTEAAIDVTYWQCQRDHRLNTVPIGYPVANTQIYILDPELQPVPIGVPGELYIGGIQLARGYLNRPELTAEKFIANPFKSGERLYKTGDLARYQPDGSIEYLHRLDNQVKVRGFRIELGEVESVLVQHPSVIDGVVLASSDPSGSTRLVAYVVPQNGSAPTTSELRRFIEKKLPSYMVPAAFILLPSLPLKPNGKIDRQALPSPDTARPGLEETFVAPRTPLEKTLADLFASVLEVDQVGVYDDFFELGGNSLLASQIINQVSQVFQVELSVVDLFETPNIVGLSDRVEKKQLVQTLSPAAVDLTGEREEIEL